MSRRHYPTAIALTVGPVETTASTIPPKGIGDPTYDTCSIHKYQVKANAFNAPMGVCREDYVRGRDQASLLSN